MKRTILTLAALLALASPGKAQQLYCHNMASAVLPLNTKTMVVAATSSSARVYVCGFEYDTSGAGNVTFHQGTGANCATTSTTFGPNPTTTGAQSFVDPSPIFRGFGTQPGNGLCATSSVAGNITVYYVQQ
jgi:hypothetical protein